MKPSRTTPTRRLAAAIATLPLSTPALAHTGVGDTGGFAHGFAHPIWVSTTFWRW